MERGGCVREDEGVYGWRGEDVWGRMRVCIGGEGRMCGEG